MEKPPNYGTLNVADFSIGAMLRAGVALRRIVRPAKSMEEAAGNIARYLYDTCRDPESSERSCALVRFYKTHSYGGLEPQLKRFAAKQLGSIPPQDEMRCLTLLGTAGDEADWNSRHNSTSHQAIPLPSADIVRQAPMIAGLIESLGLDIESVVRAPSVRDRAGGESRTYDVFHVEDARGSPFIPAQHEFVRRFGIASVVGFGGLLRSGELYAVILFSRVRIPEASAGRFRAIRSNALLLSA